MRCILCVAFLFVCAIAAMAADDPLSCRTFDADWSIDPGKGAAEWAQEAGAIDPTRAYIVECKTSTKRGRVWLKAIEIDASGAVVQEASTEPLLFGSDARWLVLQFQPHPRTAALRIVGGGDVAATFSSLRVLPFSPRVLGNADFTLPLDRKNRISLWNQETANVLPAPAVGKAALDPSSGHAKPGSILSIAAGGACALSSIDYPVPAWTDQFRAEAFVKSEGGGSAQVALIWSTDSAQEVIHVDYGPKEAAADWQRITMPPASPPPSAKTVRVALIAYDGTVRFDDADLVSEPPKAPVVRVLTNQAGYGDDDPKCCVVMTNAVPRSGVANAFAVNDAKGQAAHQGWLNYEGRMIGGGGADWGWYFWRADFSDLKQAGAYTVQATLGELTGHSHPFDVAYSRLFYATAKPCVDFFFVQRCGGDVPGWHKPCHMDDAKLPDGTHRDLTGGWHSAGDYNKLSWEYGDGGVTYALATLVESDPEYCSRFNRDEANYEDAMEEAQWGAAYLAKLQRDDGGFLKDVQQGPDRATWMNWAAPDAHTDNVRGTADDPIVLEGEGHSPLAIGAWAKLSALLKERQTENDYLERAFKAWEYAAAKADGDPLLLISTVDLFVVTKDGHFRDHARKSVETILANAPAEGLLGGGYAGSGDVPAAALAHFVIKMPGDSLKSAIKTRLKIHIDAVVAEPNNAFGISRQKFGSDGFYFEPSSSYGHNFEYLCRAWSAAKVHTAIKDRRALAYALDQINFVLGANPYGLCMMEGVGTVNPPRYHHRYIKIPGRELGKVPGTIPNGFVRDMIGSDRPGFDLSLGGREYPSYRTSEPWLVHNMFYLLAVTALHEARI
ncbi:MAG: glycoside hydrolase family 9 protein [Candidatus Hydrogenedentes bacterium]|nr:glycoside hydrolase family 9 protein [Candidatus Hydrogenedentota bacterium]